MHSMVSPFGSYSPPMPTRQTNGSIQYMPLKLDGSPVTSQRSLALQPPKIATNRSRPKDAIQFMSQLFIVEEGDDREAEISVIRIGRLEGTVSVAYRTQDGSAAAGHKYDHQEGRLIFGPGEHEKTFTVPILDDDAFDTTVDFEVFLENPQPHDACVLDRAKNYCRVLVVDNDYFPSNALAAEVKKKDELALHDIGFSLLFAFMRFVFDNVPSIRWKTIVMIIAAQLGNAYYLGMIYLKVYLVDVCLNVAHPETMDRLLIRGSRVHTAALLGFIWIAPNVILLAVDYFNMHVLEMGYNIRLHLRIHLFRKYLDYTEESRAEVPIQDLKTSIMQDIPDIVQDGYIVIFDVFELIGKVSMTTAFMLSENPKSALPIMCYAILMTLYLCCRYKKRLHLLQRNGDGESDTQGWLIHADNAYQLIADYSRKGFCVRKFEEVLSNQRKIVMEWKHFAFWNDQLIPWVTILAIGFYMGIGGKLVCDGLLSLGSFLAVINVYKDLGDRFSKIYCNIEKLIEVIEPLAGLTTMLNLETDLQDRKAALNSREAYAREWVRSQGNKEMVYDLIPIALKGLDIPHSPTVRGFSVKAPQGTVINIVGPHESGKASLLMSLMSNTLASEGQLQCSPHLKVLHVSKNPQFVSEFGLHGNLVFGLSEHSLHDPNEPRVRAILRRLRLNRSWIMDEFSKERMSPKDDMRRKSSYDDADEETPDSDEDGNGEDESNSFKWYERMSHSEQKRFHLARAFIFNPEVLVLHRPVDEVDRTMGQQLLSLLREFVDNRGLEFDPALVNERRPRTVFYTSNVDAHYGAADFVWRIGESRNVIVEKGPHIQRQSSDPMQQP